MAKQQVEWILGGSGNILGGNMGLGEEKGGIKDKGLKGSPNIQGSSPGFLEPLPPALTQQG